MTRKRIFLGIGANLAPGGFETPRSGCEAAIAALGDVGVDVVKISPWYETAPVPISDQPWFANAVIEASTELGEIEVLTSIHRVENDFGRTRSARNEARVLDIDLLDYDGICRNDAAITIPHPRLHQRAFVLLPLRDLAPEWVHPELLQGVSDLVAALPDDQKIRCAV